MTDQCPLCERRKQEKQQFCDFHNTASRNLEQGYKMWNEALGNITKEKYYSELEKQPATGHAVRELIKYFRDRQMTV